MVIANPYLHFNGNCEEAFNFYRSVFGGAFSLISRFKDVPPEQAFPEKEADKILHIALPVGKAILMGSDVPEAFPKAISGTSFYISLHTESEDEARRVFNALSAEGNIAMPLAKTFWGSFFGMVIDQYNTQWMVSYDYNRNN